jgi:type I restriction enzyme R subunit
MKAARQASRRNRVHTNRRRRAQSEQERLKRKWASVEALVGADKRLAMIAEDLVRHFEARKAALDGKAMIVCMSRRICVALYNAIILACRDFPAE